MNAHNTTFEAISELVAEKGRSLSRDIFARFETELAHVLVGQGCSVGPDAPPELQEDFRDCLSALLPEGTARVVLAPAGGYAHWLAGLLGGRIEVAGYLDSFKPETGPGVVPALKRPERAAEFQADCILLATPSVSTQMGLRTRLAACLPEDGPPLIMVAQAAATALARGRQSPQAVRDRVKEAAERLSQASPEAGSKRLFIACTSFPQHYLPVVRALRGRGHAVSLLSLQDCLMYGQGVAAYEADFTALHGCGGNMLEFLGIASEVKADVLYTFDFFMQNPLNLLLRDLWSGRMIHEVYDFSDNSGYAPSHLKLNLDRDARLNLTGLDEACRRLLFPAVDGLVYRDSEHYLKKARELIGFTTPAMQFWPYPHTFDRRRELDGEWHAVFIGHLNHDPAHPDYTVLHMGRRISAQGAHLHVYNPSDPNGCLLPEFIEEARTNPRFHYAKPMPSMELDAVLKQFDYGWMAFDFKDATDEYIERHAFTYTTRLTTYVAAGLPIICSKQNVYQAQIVQENGIGLVLGPEEFDRLGEILATADYQGMASRAAALRKTWDIRNQAGRLESYLFT